MRSCGGRPPRTSACPAHRRSRGAPGSGSPRRCTRPPTSVPSGAAPEASAAPCRGARPGPCPCPAAWSGPSACAWPVARPCVRTLVSDRGPLAHFSRFVLALEPLAAALDRRDELRQVHLQRVEDLIRVVLRTEPDLALAGASVLDDVLGGALGLLGDLLVAHQLLLALACILDDPLSLLLRLGEHLLALLDDPACLLDLLGDRRAHLIEDVVDLLLVDPDLVGHGHVFGVVHQVVELVYQYEDVHLASYLRGGTLGPRSVGRSTSISLTPISSAPQLFLQTHRHLIGDKIVDPSPERGELLDTAGGQETVLGARHQVDGLYLGILATVELVHLELVLEVRDRTQALDDRHRSHAPGELDHERRERLGADRRQVGDRALDEPHPLVDPEQRLVLAHRAVDHSHDDFVIHVRRTADHVEMPVRDRVIGPGTHDYRLLIPG